jgi:molybdenum cofactor biosynthesis protein B
MDIRSLGIALLTVSDTRGPADDASGDYLAEQVTGAGHRLVARLLCRDDRYAIRAAVSRWIASPAVRVVLTTGGTGFTGRDVTPSACAPLFDRRIEGFGELFRQLSYDEIGTSALQSSALGGIANGTLVFCLPGSRGAVRTGWERILRAQLDADHRPCNFAELIPRFLER